jgi:hypothetical protein
MKEQGNRSPSKAINTTIKETNDSKGRRNFKE